MAKDGMSFKVEGFEGIEDNLKRISKRQSKYAMTQALKDAAEPIAEDARSTVLSNSYHGGELLESIAVSTRLNKRQGRIARRMGKDSVEVYVGPGERGPHGFLVEFGTEHSAPEPFMRPAFDSQKEKALSILVDRLRANIMTAIKRNEKKAVKAKKK
jgi:HK97 gp10 family phage protein